MRHGMADAADNPHRVEKGQRVGIAAGVLAGLMDQVPQGEVGEQQAVELLLHQIRPAAAQHQPLSGQAHLQLGEAPSLCQRS